MNQQTTKRLESRSAHTDADSAITNTAPLKLIFGIHYQTYTRYKLACLATL